MGNNTNNIILFVIVILFLMNTNSSNNNETKNINLCNILQNLPGSLVLYVAVLSPDLPV